MADNQKRSSIASRGSLATPTSLDDHLSSDITLDEDFSDEGFDDDEFDGNDESRRERRFKVRHNHFFFHCTQSFLKRF